MSFFWMVAQTRWLSGPSNRQAFAACIVFGYAVTSFLHRRRLRHPDQAYIFVACVSAGALVGELMGESADYIMLVHVSWAVCVAMVVSSVSSYIRQC